MKVHLGIGLVLWASGFQPVFEDYHFKSRIRLRSKEYGLWRKVDWGSGSQP